MTDQGNTPTSTPATRKGPARSANATRSRSKKPNATNRNSKGGTTRTPQTDETGGLRTYVEGSQVQPWMVIAGGEAFISKFCAANNDPMNATLPDLIAYLQRYKAQNGGQQQKARAAGGGAA